MPALVSVNVGMPCDVDWNGVTVHTGAWKDPVNGPRWVGKLGIDSDGQGDPYGHGGPNRAVLVYQVEAYEYWRRHFARSDIGAGSFAENLTIEGLADTEVRVGDRYRIGQAEFEVSQPRVTCFRAGLRIGEPRLAALLVAHHRPGFYMRVITEGEVRAGDPIIRTAVGAENITIAAVDALLYLPDPDLETLDRAIRVDALSPGWRDSLREMLAEATRPRRPHPGSAIEGWSGFRSMRVLDRVPETDHITSFVLAPVDGPDLPEALAGQYLTLRLPGTDRDVVRSYSLSGPSVAGTYRISVKGQGGASSYLRDSLQTGMVLDVAAPRGTFVLEEDDEPVVLVSAGIGVTPVLAMLHRLVALGGERQVWWLHAARRPTEGAFAAEVGQLLAELRDTHRYTYYSAAGSSISTESVEIGGAGDGATLSGRLTVQRLAERGLPRDATAYVCGPPRFMSLVTEGLIAAGLSPDRIQTETFGVRSAINPGVVENPQPAPHQPPGAPAAGPAITFARSGLTAAFNETATSVLEFAESCDVLTRWQCRSGICHTCETPLLSGEIEYSPNPVTDPTPGTALICCARPRTALVLDM